MQYGLADLTAAKNKPGASQSDTPQQWPFHVFIFKLEPDPRQETRDLKTSN